MELGKDRKDYVLSNYMYTHNSVLTMQYITSTVVRMQSQTCSVQMNNLATSGSTSTKTSVKNV